ncbi:N-acetylmuramoyl-L-alanine amidase [Dorea acetigenes]|uniref:N-acetylmuramoyl-L-alanine amidase n=1 Tax=Dorea acetigenes TaxID=2981787 RepID=A0ABT2RS36_9FIRM|nr:N-acetylmuramoyl-L-alanine amidase [Dorea acetigenes]MCU6688225.1 N-acetylmuramoyl-L-alanine amidase [Dorea acetigenes]SCJ69827.1 Sporulation-specific N-acetylmuramoyl-L-alanine amidase [uncultured Clostridium sp.]
MRKQQPAHGGRDPGAVYNGRQEKDDNLRLALAVGEILQENGIQVEYTRTTDVYETPYQKAMEANEAGVDLFISIHRNSFPTDNVVSGVESLVYDLSGLKLQIAESINEQLEAIGFVNLGVTARPNLVVLKRTKMPAVLVEVGFMNSDTDNQLFDDNFDAIAQAIASGILDVLETNHLIPGEYGGATNLQNPSNSQNMPNPEHSGYMPVNYRVQVGAFRNRMYAERLRNELMEMDFPAFIDDSGEYLRVQVGGFDNLEEAALMERRLKREGYQTVIVSE